VIVAHANDHAPPGTSIQVSGGLLMMFGMGSIIGPLIAGVMMTNIGPQGLFITTIGAHVVMIAFTLWRMTRRAAVAEEDKGPSRSVFRQRWLHRKPRRWPLARTRPYRWRRRISALSRRTAISCLVSYSDIPFDYDGQRA
jgi:MFS family permease